MSNLAEVRRKKIGLKHKGGQGVSTKNCGGEPERLARSSAELAKSREILFPNNNGNTKTKVDATGTTTYTWDFENRLTQVVLPGTGGTVTFKYDAFGRRIQKSSPTGTVNYLYDGKDLNIIQEVDSNGNTLSRFADTDNTDEPLMEVVSGLTSYYEQDAPGSITSLSSSGGTLANTYTYNSFGKLTAFTGALTNPFQYTAREFDSETSLYYYRARYYDPSIGRFITEDPIRFEGGMNFYAYARNNPVLNTDPLGLAPGGTCKCVGSGGKPLFGVCGPYSCECSCEKQPEAAFFPMYALKRDCGWREKRCPMVIEGSSNPRMYGSVVESIKAEKCYDTRPQ